MHELSLALSMIEMAEVEAGRAGGRVSALHLKLGPLSGVVREALEFSWEVACQGTPLEGARLIIENMPVVIDCATCMEQFEVSLQDLRCPQCSGLSPNVVQGRELEVVALELEPVEELVI
jgi:hydrogenase nickel incorporation protein HypA/HybF